jgi:hypothetical protein
LAVTHRPADPTPTLLRVCDDLPGLVQAALVLVPEEVLLARVGGESALDHEPLLRAAVRCFGGPAADDSVVEYLFVTEDHFVVMQRGRKDPRLALAVRCDREKNLALVLGATRAAIAALEAEVDLTGWVE